MREKRLVIFGAGYLGGAVARTAIAAGAQVTALTRNRERAEALARAGVEVIEAELASDDWHARVSPENDYVLDCVGAGGGGLAGYRRSYVDGLQSILTWARQATQAGLLVYTSSTAVYPQDGGVRVTEDAATGVADERARLLLEAESLALQWPGVAVVLRLAGIYGPSRHHLLDTLRSGADVISGRGDHRLNLIHRDDAQALILSAFARAAAAEHRVFNGADDGAVAKEEIVHWLASQLGCPMPRFSGTPVPGRRAVTPDRIIDNARAKRVLGWRPQYTTFREGYTAILRETGKP